jgi:alanine racemase
VTRPELTGASLHIDLSALQRNYRRFVAVATPALVGAAVKADAYGLGMEPCARALWNAGCRHFFVAFPAEGIELRASLPTAEIFVLNGLLPGTAAEHAVHQLTPILAQPAELAEWKGLCRARGERLPAGIHIDTGINRLGFSERELRALDRDDLQFLRVSLVMSHLSHADEPDAPENREQLARFLRLKDLLPPARLSLANSGGTLSGAAFGFDLVRPGIGLYGGHATASRDEDCEPVVRLEAQVLQVREVQVGERVGYSGSFTAQRRSRVAIIGVGYRDGYPRALSSGPEGGPARVFIAGQPAPIVGRISMDLMAVDVTDIPQALVRRGSLAELLGPHVSLEEMAAHAGTIAYEILTRLGSRHARIYSGGDSNDLRS